MPPPEPVRAAIVTGASSGIGLAVAPPACIVPEIVFERPGEFV